MILHELSEAFSAEEISDIINHFRVEEPSVAVSGEYILNLFLYVLRHANNLKCLSSLNHFQGDSIPTMMQFRCKWLIQHVLVHFALKCCPF